MTDYISREDALNFEISVEMEPEELKPFMAGMSWYGDHIKNLPSADVEPVVRGEWIKMSDVDGVYWACSECGEDIPRIAHFNPQFDLFPKLKSIEKTSFCPNCGAEMRTQTDEKG